MRSITVPKLKKWVRENAAAVGVAIAARAVAEVERQRVDAYVEPLFRGFGFVDESGAPIAASKRLYRCRDEAAVARFYAACDVAHREHGFDGPAGHCPALVAEDAQRKAEQVVLESMCRFLGVETYQLGLEKRAELLRLICEMAAAELRGNKSAKGDVHVR